MTYIKIGTYGKESVSDRANLIPLSLRYAQTAPLFRGAKDQRKLISMTLPYIQFINTLSAPLFRGAKASASLFNNIALFREAKGRGAYLTTWAIDMLLYVSVNCNAHFSKMLIDI